MRGRSRAPGGPRDRSGRVDDTRRDGRQNPRNPPIFGFVLPISGVGAPVQGEERRFRAGKARHGMIGGAIEDDRLRRRAESSGRSDAGAPAVVPSEAAISSARPRSASHWIARIAIRSAFSGLHRLTSLPHVGDLLATALRRGRRCTPAAGAAAGGRRSPPGWAGPTGPASGRDPPSVPAGRPAGRVSIGRIGVGSSRGGLGGSGLSVSPRRRALRNRSVIRRIDRVAFPCSRRTHSPSGLASNSSISATQRRQFPLAPAVLTLLLLQPRDRRVDDLQQHLAGMLLRPRLRLAQPAAQQPLAVADGLAVRAWSSTARRTGRDARGPATKQATKIVSTSRSSTASCGRLPSRRMAWTICSSGQAVPASTTWRSSAQRSSSHRQPSAVDSRRSRRRAGSSGSSGPRWARRSRSAQTPKRRTKFGTRGGGRRRRPRSSTSSRRRLSSSAGMVPRESAIKASWTRSARSSRQDKVTTWRTRSCSKGLAGSSSAVQFSSRRWNARGSSPGRMRVSAVRPWVTAFSRDAGFSAEGAGSGRAGRVAAVGLGAFG